MISLMSYHPSEIYFNKYILHYLSHKCIFATPLLVIVLLVFGVWCLVFGIWYLVFGVWCLVFGVVFGGAGLVVLVRRINVFWWQDGNSPVANSVAAVCAP